MNVQWGLQQGVLRWLDSVASRRTRGPEHLKTGLRGELEALLHLRELGYVVVARRWKTPKLRGDIDLIAWDGDCLCFIEVKTRTQRDADVSGWSWPWTRRSAGCCGGWRGPI